MTRCTLSCFLNWKGTLEVMSLCIYLQHLATVEVISSCFVPPVYHRTSTDCFSVWNIQTFPVISILITCTADTFFMNIYQLHIKFNEWSCENFTIYSSKRDLPLRRKGLISKGENLVSGVDSQSRGQWNGATAGEVRYLGRCSNTKLKREHILSEIISDTTAAFH